MIKGENNIRITPMTNNNKRKNKYGKQQLKQSIGLQAPG